MKRVMIGYLQKALDSVRFRTELAPSGRMGGLHSPPLHGRGAAIEFSRPVPCARSRFNWLRHSVPGNAPPLPESASLFTNRRPSSEDHRWDLRPRNIPEPERPTETGTP